ncbi:hypothetical protein [Tateyamaria sp.]|uniref:hypothetical protein n=1 Tax=Tateyamaria sp. TaxID=1929288 RepID=UPI00329B2F37
MSLAAAQRKIAEQGGKIAEMDATLDRCAAMVEVVQAIATDPSPFKICLAELRIVIRDARVKPSIARAGARHPTTTIGEWR